MAGLQKILLVEDNNELRELYQIFLIDNGYTVYVAVDGEDGLEKARALQPEFIFLDVMMPKHNGFEVLKILRHDPSYNCTKARIVMLTNLGSVTKVSEEVRRDMDGYVVKAEIQLVDLLDVIHSFDPQT